MNFSMQDRGGGAAAAGSVGGTEAPREEASEAGEGAEAARNT